MGGIEESNIDSVHQGDDTKFGVIVVKISTGWLITFDNVLYMPELGTTLISRGQLSKRPVKLECESEGGAVINISSNKEQINKSECKVMMCSSDG